MSLRQKHKVWVNTSRNTDMTDLVYGPSEADRLVQNDVFDQWGGGSIDIPDTSNEDLDLVDVTNVKGIYLEVDGDVTVTINGATPALQLKKYTTTAGVVCKLFVEAVITSFNIANATGSAVNGHYHIWGSST